MYERYWSFYLSISQRLTYTAKKIFCQYFRFLLFLLLSWFCLKNLQFLSRYENSNIKLTYENNMNVFSFGVKKDWKYLEKIILWIGPVGLLQMFTHKNICDLCRGGRRESQTVRIFMTRNWSILGKNILSWSAVV